MSLEVAMRQSTASVFLLWGVVLAAVPSTGCGLDVVEFTITEDGAAGGAAFQMPGLPNFSSSLTDALSSKDVNPDDVDSMRLLECRIEMVSQGGLTNDLSFLEKLEFYVSADGLAPQLMASQPSFPQGIREADLTVTEGIELKTFLDAGNLTVTTDAPLIYPPPDIVEFKVTFKIRVDINVV